MEGGLVRKQYTPEDLAMFAQWVVCFVLAPFVLLPLFPRQAVPLAARLAIVLGAFVFSAVMTALFLRARKKSRRRAATVANVTALTDALLVLAVLLVWPRYIPEAFWILAILVVVFAARFSYRESAIAALGFSTLYLVTVAVGYRSELNKSIIADALFRVVLLLLLSMAVAYLTQREKRERKEARILSGIAAALGSTLDTDQLLQAVVDGISEATGYGRVTVFMVTQDGCWVVPRSTTERDRATREKLFRLRIDLRLENPATRAIDRASPVFIEQPSADENAANWPAEFFSTGLLVLPLVMRDEVRGIVAVERRRGRAPFQEREINLCNAVLAQAVTGMENAGRYAEEQRKRSEADTLYRASRELGSSLEMDQVLESACRLAARNTASSGCVAFLLDDLRGRLVPRVMIGGGARRTMFPPDASMPLVDFEEMYYLSQRPPALTLSNPSENPAIPAFIRTSGTLLMAPFYIHDVIGGLLCVSDAEKREYDQSEVSQLALVASEVALAVMNARLHERIKTDAAQMASLVQLANAIGSSADLPTIMRLALDSMRHLFDCTSGLIYRVDEKDGTMRCMESFGYSDEILARLVSPPFPRIEDCWAVSEEHLICIDDLSVTNVACRTLEKIGQGSSICVAIKAEGRTLGVLHIRSERPNAFGEEDQQMALAFADQVGLALQRAILFEEINRLAITDPLTGVFNVRRLEAVLADEIGRARRYKRPVSFLMVDVDNLKSYNDTMGHQQGDIVLSQIASIVDSSTREVDKVFRYGGDEFCVVLPETDSDEAIVVAEKVRRAVAEFHFAQEEKVGEAGITISAGVATFPKDCDEETGLIHKADLALYAAKQTGRNSVASAF